MHPDANFLILLHCYINHRFDEKFAFNDLEQISEFVEDAIYYIQESYNVFMSSLKTACNYPLNSNKQKKEASHIIIDIVNGYSLDDHSLLTAMAYLHQIRQWLKFDITDTINNPNIEGNTETVKMVISSVKDDKAKQVVQEMLSGNNDISKIRSAILGIDDKKSNTDEWIDSIFPENK